MFTSLITEKNVVFVGPSPYLMGQNKGTSIDKFDTVIRANSGFPCKFISDYGSRCDILYSNRLWSRVMTDDILDSYIGEVKMIVFKFLEQDIKQKCINHEKYFRLRQLPKNIVKMESNPNLGVLLINDILNFKPKTLTLMGMDFYEDENNKYYEGYHSPELIEKTKIEMHDLEENTNQIKKLIEKNEHVIILDDFIKNKIKTVGV